MFDDIRKELRALRIIIAIQTILLIFMIVGFFAHIAQDAKKFEEINNHIYKLHTIPHDKKT